MDTPITKHRLFACAGLFAGMAFGMATPANATPTLLTLINGWTNAPFSTSDAAVETLTGIVHFKGAIATTGTNAEPFVLPAAFRPAVEVYIPVDLCNGDNGRLIIDPTGDVQVEAETSFSDAQCFTSLDGASFALAATGFKNLTLINGWTDYGNGTANAAVKKNGSIIQFRGAIANGTTDAPFVLPVGDRPPTNVFVKLDLCNATNGRLQISSDGTVLIEEEDGSLDDAQCFTSLEGAAFDLNATGFTALTLLNGWTNAPFGTRNALVKKVSGAVNFQGAISSGTTGEVFQLATSFRPKAVVYVPVDLCGATNGRLVIGKDGSVTVEDEGATSITNAQCFTSLEGVSFIQ